MEEPQSRKMLIGLQEMHGPVFMCKSITMENYAFFSITVDYDIDYPHQSPHRPHIDYESILVSPRIFLWRLIPW